MMIIIITVKASYLSLEEPEPTWKMLTSSIFLPAMRQPIFRGKIFRSMDAEKNSDTASILSRICREDSNSELLVNNDRPWYNIIITKEGGDFMKTKDIIYELRTKKGLSQEELAEKIFVTRQAVSRWETGETIPNIDTLKLLSQLFDVSINTLLDSPRELICQCCGMPLEDCNISKETDGNFNEEYCKWCYADGEYTLDIWKRYVEIGGKEKLEEFKTQLIHEFNTLLHIEGLPKVEKLNVLSGEFINMEYTLPNGQKVKFLDDKQTYLGSQLESEFGGRCFGIAANMDFLLVCTYEENGENPELVIYKKR
jgi:transcriptional regulator with XRE-family HTH domain